MSCDKNLEKKVIDAFLGLDITSLIDADVQSMSSPDLELWRRAIPDLGFRISDQDMKGEEGISEKDLEHWRDNNPDMEADLKFWRQTKPDLMFRCRTTTSCPNVSVFSDEIRTDILKFKQNVPTNEEEGVLGLRGLRKLSESLEDGKDDIYGEKDFLVDEEGQNEMDVLYHIERLLKDEESDENKNDCPDKTAEVKKDQPEKLDKVKTDIPEDWNSPFPSPPILETDPYFFNSNAHLPFSSNPSSFQSPRSSFTSSPAVQDFYTQSEYQAPPVENYLPGKSTSSSPSLDVPNRPSNESWYGFPPCPQHSYNSNSIGSRRVYPNNVKTGSYPSVMYPPPPFCNPDTALKRWNTIPVDICRQNSIPKTSLDFPIYVHKPTYSVAAQSSNNFYSAAARRSNNGAMISTIPRFNPLKKPQPLTKVSSASKKLTSNVTRLVCGFCKQNGERKEVYQSHSLHSLGIPGRVTCPMLASHVCETCGATGEKAHTKNYCPELRNEEKLFEPLPLTLKKTLRKSDGKLRKC